MAGDHGGLCRRVFFLFATFLLTKFLLLLVSAGMVEVGAVRESRDIQKKYDNTYNGSEYWKRKKQYIPNGIEASKLGKIKTNTNQFESKEGWWKERPSKEDIGFIWKKEEVKSRRRGKKKKKRIVKTHNHKFAISHNDL